MVFRAGIVKTSQEAVMNKTGVILGLLSVVGCVSAARADLQQTFTNSLNSNSNLRGLHIDRPTGDTPASPYGFSLDAAGLPKWDFGLATNQRDFRFFSHG